MRIGCLLTPARARPRGAEDRHHARRSAPVADRAAARDSERSGSRRSRTAPTRILDGVKSLSYAANMLASRLARERGFDEALLVTPHGRVLEAPTSSIFWVSR